MGLSSLLILLQILIQVRIGLSISSLQLEVSSQVLFLDSLVLPLTQFLDIVCYRVYKIGVWTGYNVIDKSVS